MPTHEASLRFQSFLKNVPGLSLLVWWIFTAWSDTSIHLELISLSWNSETENIFQEAFGEQMETVCSGICCEEETHEDVSKIKFKAAALKNLIKLIHSLNISDMNIQVWVIKHSGHLERIQTCYFFQLKFIIDDWTLLLQKKMQLYSTQYTSERQNSRAAPLI